MQSAKPQPDTPGILWLVLDQASQALLREKIRPLHPDTYYHHVTLQYDVPLSTVQAYIGRQETIACYAVAWNDKVQAVRVRTNSLPDPYGAPHVTLSALPSIKPYESVAMLQDDHEETTLKPPLALQGVIRFQSLR